MKILLYNSFPFHHEMLGFFLHYCTTKKIEASVYNPNDNEKFLEGYQILNYKFELTNNIHPDSYDFVIILTDSDNGYPKEYIRRDKTITICHWYIKRNMLIQKQIPVGPFNRQDGTYRSDFILPVNKLVNLEKKLEIWPITNIRVIAVGRFVPESVSELDLFNSDVGNVTFTIISRWSPHPEIMKDPRVTFKQETSAAEMWSDVCNSEYLWILDHNPHHVKGFSISASVALAFSALTTLLIPEKMNRHLRLRSAVTYTPNSPIHLPLPDIKLVSEECEQFLNQGYKIFDDALLI